MTVPLLDEVSDSELDRMAERAQEATDFLKTLAHEGRLMILCYLASGPKSVTELEQLLAIRQPSVSQQLARLRSSGFVDTERDGKVIYYSLADERATKIVEMLYDMFCAENKDLAHDKRSAERRR